MKKVLLVQKKISSTRTPVFSALADRVDLTVLYSEGEPPKGIKFKAVQVPLVRLKKISFYKKSLRSLAKRFDAVIAPLEFTNLSIMGLPLKPRAFKVIYWTIGVPASYDVPYDSRSSYDHRYTRQINRSDACVFYTSYPVEKYAKLGVKKEKLFVANNTVQVLPYDENVSRDNIIFVGSLYKQKRIFELLDNYKAAYDERREIPNLIIVGDGDEYAAVNQWITDNGLKDKVLLKGAIYDEEILLKLFTAAIVCISPGQAGLTVLKAMGYGVPFITTKDAITGGEIFNIKNRENGLILDTYPEIKDVILDTLLNKEKFVEMGKNAKSFYEKNRQVGMMTDGFEQAINFVCNIDK